MGTAELGTVGLGAAAAGAGVAGVACGAAGAGFPTTVTAPPGATTRRATSVVGTMPRSVARRASAAAEFIVATSRCRASAFSANRFDSFCALLSW